MIVGTLGITIPFVIDFVYKENNMFHNIPLRLTTYFISVLFAGSLDYFLRSLKKNKGPISDFLISIALILTSIVLVVFSIIAHYNYHDGIAYFLSISGVILAWVVWWLANNDNPKFEDSPPEVALGGSTDNAFKN